MKYVDYKFQEICEEVDQWKDEAKYWKEKFEALDREISKKRNDDFQRSKKGIGQALRLVLSIRENEDGSISIPKEKRKELSNIFD